MDSKAHLFTTSRVAAAKPTVKGVIEIKLAKPVFISPGGRGWIVQQGGKTISEHYTKDPARESGRREAKKDEAELIEQSLKGVIISKDSFGPESKVIDKEH